MTPQRLCGNDDDGTITLMQIAPVHRHPATRDAATRRWLRRRYTAAAVALIVGGVGVALVGPGAVDSPQLAVVFTAPLLLCGIGTWLGLHAWRCHRVLSHAIWRDVAVAVTRDERFLSSVTHLDLAFSAAGTVRVRVDGLSAARDVNDIGAAGVAWAASGPHGTVVALPGPRQLITATAA